MSIIKGASMAVVTFKTKDRETVEMDTALSRVARMKRRLDAWSRAMNKVLDSHEVKAWKIALTYDTEGTKRAASEWQANHIRELMLILSKHLKNKLYAYAWVAELQQRGVIHYHICLVTAPDAEIPHLDTAGWWPHGDTRVEAFKDNERISGWYLAKYVQKGLDGGKGFPKNARMYATVIRVEITQDERFFFRLSAATGCVRHKLIDLLIEWGANWLWDGWKWKAVKGGGWLIERGSYWCLAESEWVYLGVERTSWSYKPPRPRKLPAYFTFTGPRPVQNGPIQLQLI